jgi:glycosyltransferase involved in cell wall biosynthesis
VQYWKGGNLTILLIHNYYKIRGGEDSVYENEASGLEKNGHRVIRYFRKNSETDGYGFIRKIFFFFSAIHSFRTVKDIKKITAENNIDIAHIHNTFPLVSPSVYRILKKKKIKTVQTLHNFRFLCPNGLFFRDNEVCTLCKDRRYSDSVRYRCYRNSRTESILYYLILTLNRRVFTDMIGAYIALTGFTRNLFVESGFDVEKIFIKDNGLPDNDVRRKKSGGYFYYFGRISNEKGIGFLLESFTRLGLNLVVSGGGENLARYEEKYSSGNIRFTGFLNPGDIGGFIAGAQSVILPSCWFENYPMTIVESFRCGIPVIATDMGSIPFIIKDNGNGMLFEKNNFEEFGKKILLMSGNDELRERLGNNARKTFEERMEFGNNIKVLENIYRTVMNKKQETK